jgi:hypothetical protein
MLVRWLVTAPVLIALLIAGCGGSDNDTNDARDTEAIVGNWGGTLTQQGLKPFKIAGFIDPHGQAAVVYTGINCGGTWSETEGDPPNSYTFTEHIQFGSGGNCKGIGTVTLKRAGAQLAYTFHGGGVASTGTLSRITDQEVHHISRQAGMESAADQ